MLKTLIFLAGVVAVFCANPRPAEACRCRDPSPAAAEASADLVFTGVLIQAERAGRLLPGATARHRRSSSFTFLVDHVYKGKLGLIATVASPATTCGWQKVDRTHGRAAGKRYIIYAKRRGGKIRTRKCYGNRLASSKAGRNALRGLASKGHAPDPVL